MSYTVKFQSPASYSGNWYKYNTIGKSGCGPASVCSALENAGIADVSVPTMCALAVSCGARVDGGTVMSTLLNACKNKYGITYKSTSKNADLIAHLKAGRTAVCWCGGGYPLFSDRGHFVAAVGLDSCGLVYIADSLYYDEKWKRNSVRKAQIKPSSTTGIVRCSITALGKATADRSPSYFLISKANTSTKNTDGKDTNDMTETEVRALIDKVMKEKAKEEASSWAESAFEDATKAGILDGTQPQAPLTREQFAVVLHKLHFCGDDTTPSNWAADAFQAATDSGILDGSNPHGYVTREMLTQVLQKCNLIGTSGIAVKSKEVGTC